MLSCKLYSSSDVLKIVNAYFAGKVSISHCMLNYFCRIGAINKAKSTKNRGWYNGNQLMAIIVCAELKALRIEIQPYIPVIFSIASGAEWDKFNFVKIGVSITIDRGDIENGIKRASQIGQGVEAA